MPRWKPTTGSSRSTCSATAARKSPARATPPPNQAELVAEALEELGVRDAEVVGHSLGGAVSVALAEQSPQLVDRVVIVDMPPDNSYGDLGFIAGLAFQPVLGEALWTIKPDFSVSDGLGVAFAPGFDVPDAFVDDVKRLTYTAYDESPDRSTTSSTKSRSTGACAAPASR